MGRLGSFDFDVWMSAKAVTTGLQGRQIRGRVCTVGQCRL